MTGSGACGEAIIVDETAQVGDASTFEAVIPVSRGRALSRTVVWMVPAVVGAAIASVVYPKLGFTDPSGVNRLVAYSAAIVTLPAPIATLLCGFRSLRYLLLAVWPGRLCVKATAKELVLQLGPFKTRRYDATSMAIQYPYELEDDEGGGGFEAYLPEEEQIARLLPRMMHALHNGSLRQTILDFCTGDESTIAATMRPVIQRWRSVSASEKDGTEDAHAN